MERALILCIAVIFADSVFCGIDNKDDHGMLRGKEHGEHFASKIKRQIPMPQNPSDFMNQAKDAMSEQMENFKNAGGNPFTGNGKIPSPPMMQ